VANDQLAARAGVEPGAYSTAQLIQMITALEEGDNAAYRFVRDGGAEVVSSQSPFGGARPRNDNLAATAGVEPGAYSTAQLIQMIMALEEGDNIAYRFVRDGGAEVVSSQSPGGLRPVSQGKAQLAASLGVDPNDYSVAELADMYIDAND
jgi:D-serine deaminase-like pyridoxal phosphate-dependent protein